MAMAYPRLWQCLVLPGPSVFNQIREVLAIVQRYWEPKPSDLSHFPVQSFGETDIGHACLPINSGNAELPKEDAAAFVSLNGLRHAAAAPSIVLAAPGRKLDDKLRPPDPIEGARTANTLQA